MNTLEAVSSHFINYCTKWAIPMDGLQGILLSKSGYAWYRLQTMSVSQVDELSNIFAEYKHIPVDVQGISLGLQLLKKSTYLQSIKDALRMTQLSKDIEKYVLSILSLPSHGTMLYHDPDLCVQLLNEQQCLLAWASWSQDQRLGCIQSCLSQDKMAMLARVLHAGDCVVPDALKIVIIQRLCAHLVEHQDFEDASYFMLFKEVRVWCNDEGFLKKLVSSFALNMAACQSDAVKIEAPRHVSMRDLLGLSEQLLDVDEVSLTDKLYARMSGTVKASCEVQQGLFARLVTLCDSNWQGRFMRLHTLCSHVQRLFPTCNHWDSLKNEIESVIEAMLLSTSSDKVNFMLLNVYYLTWDYMLGVCAMKEERTAVDRHRWIVMFVRYVVERTCHSGTPQEQGAAFHEFYETLEKFFLVIIQALPTIPHEKALSILQELRAAAPLCGGRHMSTVQDIAVDMLCSQGEERKIRYQIAILRASYLQNCITSLYAHDAHNVHAFLRAKQELGDELGLIGHDDIKNVQDVYHNQVLNYNTQDVRKLFQKTYTMETLFNSIVMLLENEGSFKIVYNLFWNRSHIAQVYDRFFEEGDGFVCDLIYNDRKIEPLSVILLLYLCGLSVPLEVRVPQ